MRISLTKHDVDRSVLRCVRDDGTETWQRQDGAQARFFPLHDLAHYAVETILGARTGFYGLVAAGWDIADTTGKGARGPIPDETVAIEQLVGMLDRERAAGVRWAADDLNAQLAAAGAIDGHGALRPLDDATLDAVRARVSALHAGWQALDRGAALELRFPA